MEMRKQLTLNLYAIVNILHMSIALCTTTRKRYQRRTLMKRPINRVLLQIENLN